MDEAVKGTEIEGYPIDPLISDPCQSHSDKNAEQCFLIKSFIPCFLSKTEPSEAGRQGRYFAENRAKLVNYGQIMVKFLFLPLPNFSTSFKGPLHHRRTLS